MSRGALVILEEEQRQIQAICDALAAGANARAVLFIDRNGLEVARSGQTDQLDIPSLSTLFAGNVAATGGIAQLLEEKEFSGQLHKGEKVSVLTWVVAQRIILVVLFDESRATAGLVQLRTKKAAQELTRVIDAIVCCDRRADTAAALGELSDADIDNLFSEGRRG